MVGAQSATAKDAERRGEEAYQAAMYLMIGIGVGVAIFVARRTARIEADLVAEKMRAQLTLHSISDAIVTIDVHGNVNYVNRVAWSDEEARGQPLAKVLNIIDLVLGESHFASFNPTEIERTAYDQHTAASLLARNSTVLSAEYHVSPIQDHVGHVIGSVIVVHDVTQAAELTRRLSWAATHDALTGLVNRSEFERQLDELLHDGLLENREHALLYLDLDQFKVVNDTCGHMAGDELLRQLAVCLEQKIRSNDMLARLGGDEFGILLASCHLSKASEIAESLRDAVKNFRFSWQDKVFDVGVSIGLVPVNAQSENSASLLSSVDAACYAAKDQGRNRVHIFEPGDEELMRRRGEMDWAQQVSQAIKENRLTLYFQKIVPISQRAEKHVHYELLIRMLDQDGNLVQPWLLFQQLNATI